MATRINTKMKRLNKLSTSLRHTNFFKGEGKAKVRARTFTTNEAAEKYATEKNMKNYSIVSAKKDKRFKIEVNDIVKKK